MCLILFASTNLQKPMVALPAVRFLASKASKSKHGPAVTGHVQLRLRIKAGASKPREGILAVTSTAVEVGVAAQPRQGEANEAVLRVLSEAIGVPKSRLRIVGGFKAKDKMATIECDEQGHGPVYADTILHLLREASHDTGFT